MAIESKTTDVLGNGHGFKVPALTPAPLDKPSPSTLTGELHNLLADIEHLIQEATAITSEDLAKAKEKLAERMAVARRSVAEMSSAVAQGARHNAEVANRYVHEQPWAVIGAGAGLGFLCGYLAARRTH